MKYVFQGDTFVVNVRSQCKYDEILGWGCMGGTVADCYKYKWVRPIFHLWLGLESRLLIQFKLRLKWLG